MNLLKFTFLIISVAFIFSCTDNISDYSELTKIEPNKYGLKVISTKDQYFQLVKFDSNFTFVDLEQFIPKIKLDIRYATTDNFTGKVVYDRAKAFVRLPVAKQLKSIQNDLNSKGIGLKIFDAYRPYSITLKFWDLIKDSNFVATPWGASRHNRGCAVDVSLIDLQTGLELAMPSEYDDFSDKAYPDNNEFSEEILINRKLLIDVMKKYSFIVYPTEWWHYDFIGYQQYPITDINFDQLDSLK